MSTQLLFYKEVTPITADKHKDLSIKSGGDFGFAKNTNSVPIAAVEFRQAASEYGIVFVQGQDEAVVPVALLGAKKDENIFVNEDGKWDARYVPAFVRRYPFVFSLSEDKSTFTLCIDEGFEGCNSDGKGERLFDAEGERTSYLEQVLAFQQDYQKQHQITLAFGAKLKELDLLEQVNVTIEADGSKHQLQGMLAVSREKLKELDEETVNGLFKTDALELIYLHLQSLNNLADIGKKMAGGADELANAEDTGSKPH